MILDSELYFADKQSVSATAYGSNTVDCGQALLTTGLNNGMDLVVAAVATTAYAGTATVALELQDCATSSGTFAACASSAPVLLTELSKQPLMVKMPLSHKQYIKCRFVVSGTPTTTGALSAFITESKDMQTNYDEEDGSFQ